MIESIDIIMFALPRWDAPYSSTAYSLAKEFSKKNRVFYIDNPISIKYFLKNIMSPEIKRRRSALLWGKNPFFELNKVEIGNLVTVTPKLTIPINFLPMGSFYNALSDLNDNILFQTVKDMLNQYSITNYIFINSFNPFYFRKFPSFFKPKLFIYHVVDDIRYSAYVSKHGPVLEEEIIKRADLVIATSRQLEKLKSVIARNVGYLPNAADINLFNLSLEPNFNEPSDITSLDRPIVIYTGHIDGRIDYDLMEYCLKSHPDKLFLMVGPLALDNKPLEKLLPYQNILFVGAKSLKDLPAYLHFSHCAIIPFKCNTLTSSIYPLKINEYLAAGKPVVSTAFSEDIMDFKNVIEIASNSEAFAKCIDIAILDSPEKLGNRLRVARDNSWESRVNSFWKMTKKITTQI